VTAARHVWIATLPGPMLRADRVLSLELRGGSSWDYDDVDNDPPILDASVWARLEPTGEPILVEVDGAKDAPANLAELLRLLAEADRREEPVLYLRLSPDPVNAHSLAWTLTPEAPVDLWTTQLHGLTDPHDDLSTGSAEPFRPDHYE
jgi:hypothetical protein